ncbi:hypothetical protein BSIN_3219 [Burkholderia singularis]|uniref:Uncharacterized protein n=1 Tax=Burkholderia singularis TaxID=1503053 RepID=A0A238H4G4_9BURK|nr:hypothetical protein BSIN_3219 [Burkholderia singularis]
MSVEGRALSRAARLTAAAGFVKPNPRMGDGPHERPRVSIPPGGWHFGQC